MPPIFDPPVCAVNATSTTLMSADGSRFVAFRAQPQTPSGVGIVLLPDLRGLSTFYEKLAIRLAEQGHTALAIDYFGRTAGTGPREAGFPFMEHLLKVTRTALHDDIEAAAESLRTHDGGNCRGVLALGFCFGGRQHFSRRPQGLNSPASSASMEPLAFTPTARLDLFKPHQNFAHQFLPYLGADTGIHLATSLLLKKR